VVHLAVMLATPACGSQPIVHELRFLSLPVRIEPDCLGCWVWVDDYEEIAVRYVEQWTTEEAMRRRVRSAGFTHLLEVLEYAREAPRVQFDFVTATRGLDYVADVRGHGRAPDG
jgi:hypothetical protein